MILKFQSANMHCPMLCHVESFQKMGRALASHISPAKNAEWTAFHTKMPLLELHDMLTQDLTDLCKRVPLQFLEFDDFGNLAALTKC